MIILNLETHNQQEEIIKTYLQNNVNEILAEKINKGIKITKDNKPLISKKTLKGFMDYASKQAQEQAEKGATSAMIEDKVVFGWALHYFEEDSIEGELFNLDNTPYKPPKPTYNTKPVETPVKKENNQPNLFDFLVSDKKEENKENDNVELECENEDFDNDEDTEEITEEKTTTEEPSQLKEKKEAIPFFQKYQAVQNTYKDHVIIFKIGDFYEIFGNNATKLSDILDLTLTSRDVGIPYRQPMIGFPYHVKDKYIDKILNHFPAVIYEDNKLYIKKKNEITPNNIDFETGEIITPSSNQDELIEILRQQIGDVFEVQL